MKENKLHLGLVLCFSTLLMLFTLSLIRPFSIGGWQFKPIDLLADVKEEPVDSAFQELLVGEEIKVATEAAIKIEKKSPCKPGITCIEDYSRDSTALKYFLEALSKQKDKKKPLRIAMYGDSFIEGDVFCGSFRDTLQSIFGGRGVGFVPITSQVKGFRNTIKHDFENWKTFSLISKKDSTTTTTIEIGPAGYSFIPEEDNWVEYKPSRQRFLREFSSIKLYYKNIGNAMLNYSLNDTLSEQIPLEKSKRLKEWKVNKRKVKSVSFKFDRTDSLQVYGASFEDEEGIYVDNFSLRGNSGIVLQNISSNMYEEFNRYRDYKLIILQYGLNVAREDVKGYEGYAIKMIEVVKKFKKAFPKASILLISVSDRSINSNGDFKTMEAIPALRNAQRYVAQKTGIAFWDLFEAMGGANSMVKLAEARPALAAKDYTHLNFKGGRKLARLLVNSVLFEREKHEQSTLH